MRPNITRKILQISGFGFGGYPLDCERAPYVSMSFPGARTSENQLETLLLASAQIVARGVPPRIASHPDVLFARHATRGAGMRDEPLRTSACETTTRILTCRTRCLAHSFWSKRETPLSLHNFPISAKLSQTLGFTKMVATAS